MSIIPCKEADCQRKVQARGMCSTHYSYWHRANNGRLDKAHHKDCAFCTSRFETTTPRTIYCSLVCAQRHRAGWSTSKDIVVYAGTPKPVSPLVHTRTANRLTCGSCRVCGDLFVSFETGVTCSSTCWKIRQRELRHEAGQRRRALKRNAYVSPVYRKNVFKSDGYRCHICNKMTNKNAIVPHPMAPTIDHVIPLAKGGTHEPINCRTAHFICNSTKGDRLAGDQMLLFAM
jgi:5-methylcytosine-specific restriction endonuclease McrA